MLRFSFSRWGAVFAATAVIRTEAWGSVGGVLPTPLSQYQDPIGGSLWDTLVHRATVDPFNVAALVIFACAIVHTFLAAKIRGWAHVIEERHAARQANLPAARRSDADADGMPDEVSFAGQTLHFFGEVEAVFGLWALVLAGAITWFKGWPAVVGYIGERVNY